MLIISLHIQLFKKLICLLPKITSLWETCIIHGNSTQFGTVKQGFKIQLWHFPLWKFLCHSVPLSLLICKMKQDTHSASLLGLLWSSSSIMALILCNCKICGRKEHYIGQLHKTIYNKINYTYILSLNIATF